MSIHIPELTLPPFVPEPYTYSGSSFPELPYLACHYLQEVVGVTRPDKATPHFIQQHREKLIFMFLSELVGNSQNLRTAWVYFQMAIQNATTEAATRLEECKEDFMVLMNDRERQYCDFMQKFDALVWLETAGRGWGGVKGAEEEQHYRDEKCGLQEVLLRSRKECEELVAEVGDRLKANATSRPRALCDDELKVAESQGPQMRQLEQPVANVTPRCEELRAPRSPAARRSNAPYEHAFGGMNSRKRRIRQRSRSSTQTRVIASQTFNGGNHASMSRRPRNVSAQ